jgi:hypothetical protein
MATAAYSVSTKLDRADLEPLYVRFAQNGDLYFGTYQEGSTSGVWRIPGALQSEQEFNIPQQVLPPTGNSVDYIAPQAFLSTGPFRGDLLIIEGRNEDGAPNGRVLRALGPGFTSAKEFIPAHNDPEGGQPFLPVGLAINSGGDVFITDSNNGKILRYGPDGSFKGLFGSVVHTLEIAIGPDDLVYVTNGGGLYIFDTKGNLVSPAMIPSGVLHGVTVCAPR